MQALIENLVKLQTLDLDRARLNHELRALPAEIAQSQARLAAAQRQSADTSAALSREDTLRTRLDREIDGHRKKAAKFRAQLDDVTTPEQATAMEHEIQFETAEADRLENEEYTSLERTETQEAALAQSRAQVELFAAEVEGVRARVAARQQELAAELAALDTAREAVRSALDPDWLARFDRTVASRGTGIARAENQQCTGCRMGVRPQVWNQLREGELLSCDSCNRLLYWDPALAPAPKAPQPELSPGAGRAPRKPHQAGA
jgi:predicted  nucleic acid-binding Zn-ribbon protein